MTFVGTRLTIYLYLAVFTAFLFCAPIAAAQQVASHRRCREGQFRSRSSRSYCRSRQPGAD